MIFAVFADAIGFHYLSDKDIKNRFYQLFKCVVPAKSLLAYSSGIHASIWTSSYINEHGKWLNYALRAFPESEIDVSQFAWKLESFITFLSKKIFFNPEKYYVPKKISKFFEKIEYDFHNPFYHEKLPSLFKVLDENSIDFKFSTIRRVEELQNLSKDREVNIAFLDEFDALGHRCGPHSVKVKERILNLLNELEIVKKKHSDMLLVLFSDHGMHEIEKRFNAFEKLKLLANESFKLGKDYMVFFDATMTRFWFKSESAEQTVREILSEAPGLSLSLQQKEDYKVPVSGKFGDLIFLAEPGVEMFPNYYHPSYATYVRGLHGYAPEAQNSYGIFASSKELDCKEISLLDISPTLVKCLGLDLPQTWKGAAHDFL